ncbi:hypothetical protein HAX54_012671, partial [Datura stramonium]|nr:hypothetical protein [Datura stramonium]
QEGEALDVGQAAFKTNLNMVSNILLSKDLVDLFSDSKVELKDVIWQVMAEEVGRNSTLWEDPLVFKPESIENGLIMLGSLLNSFNWKLEADIGPAELDMEEKFGISLSKAHPLQAIPCPL